MVKRIHDSVVAHPKFRQMFEAEVRSMANFDHPYAVGLIEAALDDPIGPCLVMEYVPGITLEAVSRDRHKRQLEPERVGRLLGCFCHALQAAHTAGIVHRDLKPSNLMVVNPDTLQETVKVMDFGFAGFAAKPHIQLAELTGHGPIYAIGTPGYVSPEMIRGDRVDGRSDLYSVGVILFEMLTGRLPFDARMSRTGLLAALSQGGAAAVPQDRLRVHASRRLRGSCNSHCRNTPTNGTRRRRNWSKSYGRAALSLRFALVETAPGRMGGAPPVCPEEVEAKSRHRNWSRSRPTRSTSSASSRRTCRTGWRQPSSAGSWRTSRPRC